MDILKELKNQTVQFKKDFLDKYRKSVVKEFDSLKDRYEINTVFKQIEQESGVKNIYHTRKEYNRAQRIQEILFDFKHNRIDKRIAKEVDHAGKIFDSKLMKLYDRLERKGFSNRYYEDFQVVINYSYPNLEGYIKLNGIIAVNFYTIVAEGPIQRPHYRYLIK